MNMYSKVHTQNNTVTVHKYKKENRMFNVIRWFSEDFFFYMVYSICTLQKRNVSFSADLIGDKSMGWTQS